MSELKASGADSGERRARMTEQARAILLAEALGDLSELNKGVAQVKQALDEIAADAQQHKDWTDQLGLKIAELNALRIVDLASAPLQSQAERFMRALGADIKRVVDAEAKRALASYIEAQRQKVMWAGMAISFFAGLVVGLLI